MKHPVPIRSLGSSKPSEGQLVPASQIIPALSYGLDLTSAQKPGHSVQTCLIGMGLAGNIGLPVEAQADLYYALLLKDLGCSSNASKLFHLIHSDEIRAKRDWKDTDWAKAGWESVQDAIDLVSPDAPFFERVRTLMGTVAKRQVASCELVTIRSKRGASLSRRMGFSKDVSTAIRSLDEHWNGRGYPEGLRGEEIPLFSRIINLAQTLAGFQARHGSAVAKDVLERRATRWFDPELVEAAKSLANSGTLWTALEDPNILSQVASLEPSEHRLMVDQDALDNICLGFAEVIDSKSPFTYQHSNRVAEVAVGVALRLGLAEAGVKSLHRAAMLHDIGKLGVPNTILEKADPLTSDELAAMKAHPQSGSEILRRISGFEELADLAAAHHERLDGSGYFRQLTAAQLSTPARILAVADEFDTLATRRPGRDGLPRERVLDQLRRQAPHALDPDCLAALADLRIDSSRSLVALTSIHFEEQSNLD